MNKKTKIALFVALAIGAIAVSYWGYTKHKEEKELEERNKNATPIKDVIAHLKELAQRNKK